LNSVVRASNMVAFDSTGKIRRYNNVGEILEDFYGARLDAYERRKTSELRRMDAAILELMARLKFIESILNGHLVVANQADDVLLKGLRDLALPPLSSPETPGDLKAYEYLLRIRIDRIKATAVEELRKEVAAATAERSMLAGKSAETLWLEDLVEFEKSYTAFVKTKGDIRAEAEKEHAQVVKPKKAPVPRKPKA